MKTFAQIKVSIVILFLLLILLSGCTVSVYSFESIDYDVIAKIQTIGHTDRYGYCIGDTINDTQKADDFLRLFHEAYPDVDEAFQEMTACLENYDETYFEDGSLILLMWQDEMSPNKYTLQNLYRYSDNRVEVVMQCVHADEPVQVNELRIYILETTKEDVKDVTNFKYSVEHL